MNKGRIGWMVAVSPYYFGLLYIISIVLFIFWLGTWALWCNMVVCKHWWDPRFCHIISNPTAGAQINSHFLDLCPGAMGATFLFKRLSSSWHSPSLSSPLQPLLLLNLVLLSNMSVTLKLSSLMRWIPLSLSPSKFKSSLVLSWLIHSIKSYAAEFINDDATTTGNLWSTCKLYGGLSGVGHCGPTSSNDDNSRMLT